jgi:hypothetical protein
MSRAEHIATSQFLNGSESEGQMSLAVAIPRHDRVTAAPGGAAGDALARAGSYGGP